jgi:hypothetical protein
VVVVTERRGGRAPHRGEAGRDERIAQRGQALKPRPASARTDPTQERDGSLDLVADAVRILGEMEQALAQMDAHHAAAQEQPPEASVDEPNPAKVEPLG